MQFTQYKKWVSEQNIKKKEWKPDMGSNTLPGTEYKYFAGKYICSLESQSI